MELEPRVLGPAMPARYPLSGGGGTLLYVLALFNHQALDIIVDRQKHLKGGGEGVQLCIIM